MIRAAVLFILLWVNGFIVGTIVTTVWIWRKLATGGVTVRPVALVHPRLRAWLRV